MKTEELVQEIHSSDIFGCFIETGCGVPVASALLSVSGASKTVFMCECPYSKQYVDGKYGNGDFRAISAEYVKQMVETNLTLHGEAVNTVYAASFQIGDDITTHGWIGLRHKGITKYFHITLHDKLQRTEYIERIAQNAIKLIHARNEVVPMDCDVDMVLNADLTQDQELSVLFLMNSTQDVYLNFTTKGIVRLEDSFRGKENIVLYKGSFNPPTVAHVEIAEKTIANYGNAAFAFMISIETFTKGTLPVEQIIQRVKWINSLGYGIIINKKGMFRDAIEFFGNKFNANIIFPIGEDTKNRMEADLFLHENVFFPCYKRTGISSTSARQFIADGNSAELREILPEVIFDDLAK
jgi:uncharacterized protein with HEPN domain